jgi:hypothetical protein
MLQLQELRITLNGKGLGLFQKYHVGSVLGFNGTGWPFRAGLIWLYYLEFSSSSCAAGNSKDQVPVITTFLHCSL